jgi:hypothetical protein
MVKVYVDMSHMTVLPAQLETLSAASVQGTMIVRLVHQRIDKHVRVTTLENEIFAIFAKICLVRGVDRSAS